MKKWVLKWDYNRFPFKDVIDEYNNHKKNKDEEILTINYKGISHAKTKEELNIKKEYYRKHQANDIRDKDDLGCVYIMFIGVPGSADQIYLMAYDIEIKDENGYFVCDWEDDNEYKIQRYAKVKKIKWVVDKDMKFTKEVINSLISDHRSPLVEVTNNKNFESLGIDNHLVNYSEYKYEMKAISNCYFMDKFDSLLKQNASYNHKTFLNKLGLPYIEKHHFIFQEKYRNYKGNKKNELEKLIYNPKNEIMLCPECHRMIHNGKKEVISKMVEIIRNDKDLHINDNIKKIANILEIPEDELISSMYNI